VTHVQDGSQVPSDADLFVYSDALPEDAPERKKAKEYKIRSLSYFQALGELTAGYDVIAVAGTHGKSSTTSMAALLLVDAGLDPTVVVGTKVPDLDGKNFRKGGSKLFLVEACEYRRHFLHFQPKIILVTNADGDHFDSFTSVDDYRNAFREFLGQITSDGAVITHLGDADCRAVTDGIHSTVIDADQFSLPTLAIPGAHQRQNAQLVLALADHVGVDPKKARESLARYRGSWRRMEVKGKTKEGALVIDDYAHHPREIAATVAGAREAYGEKKIIGVLQPHMHNRTIALYDDFLTCFKGLDLLVLTDIYDARSDTESETVDIHKFAEDIAKHSGIEVQYAGGLAQAKAKLQSGLLHDGDVVLVMGAGDVTNLATEMTQ
jgi:UDP-N-acetylmuramate--alanine ligase